MTPVRWKVACSGFPRMLRITVHQEHGWATLRVEGMLIGPWVAELERCWQETVVTPEQMVVDLNELMFMDSHGRALLERMYSAGTQLRARPPLTAYIIEQIEERYKCEAGGRPQ